MSMEKSGVNRAPGSRFLTFFFEEESMRESILSGRATVDDSIVASVRNAEKS